MWVTQQDRLSGDISAWERAVASRRARLGIAVVWLNGNELYSRHTLAASFTDTDLAAIWRVARQVTRQLLLQAEEVLLLGPVPRPQGELLGTQWNHTAAYKLERTLLTLADGERVKLATIGRGRP